jgi:rhodanese-related sulfurtransferase
MLLESFIPDKTLLFTTLMLLITITLFTGCSKKTDTEPYQKSTDLEFTTITAAEAKNMMDTDSEITILDVRTEEEYNTGHIEGSILLPNDEISEQAEEKLKDKDATILVYCRSGRRSAMAAEVLSELGYTKVYDFGGILDWNYDIVIE